MVGTAPLYDDASGENVSPHFDPDAPAARVIIKVSNAKATSTYIGHANTATTLDLYGQLVPGNASDAAALLDAFSGEQNRREWSLTRPSSPSSASAAPASPSSYQEERSPPKNRSAALGLLAIRW
jgi:hypothetical protein